MAFAKTDKIILSAAYLLAGLSFVPVIGVLFGLAAIAAGLIGLHHGGRKLALAGAAGIGFSCLVLLSLVLYLTRGVPSIYDKPVPFCHGKTFELKGEYLTFERIPKATLRLLKVVQPNLSVGVEEILNHQMAQEGDQLVDWQARALALTFWLSHYPEGNLTTYYLNKVYFGEGCYGMDAAAKAYFKKDISLLSLEENAALFAMLKSPDSYSVLKHPDQNRGRAEFLLNKAKD